MSLDRLQIAGLRNLREAELAPGPGLNWLHGLNGAGKTSVLEAIYLLARGRSFRSHRIGPIIQHGCEQIQVVARRRQDGRMLGMERSVATWRGRIAGQDSRRLSEFAAKLPLVLMEPDSHRLVDGGPEHRRQYLDWQLFHVEHDYLSTWQRYARMLRQRNTALKTAEDDALLRALERPMAEAGEVITRLRADWVSRLNLAVSALADQLGIVLPGPVTLRYRSGHPADVDLADSLAAARLRDREAGFTRQGPHRADMVLACSDQPAAQELSRGQQKLLALLLLLAQLESLLSGAGPAPMLLLDDPVSELDGRHLGLVLDWVSAHPVQTWVTSTSDCPGPATVFHVEQGWISAMV